MFFIRLVVVGIVGPAGTARKPRDIERRATCSRQIPPQQVRFSMHTAKHVGAGARVAADAGLLHGVRSCAQSSSYSTAMGFKRGQRTVLGDDVACHRERTPGGAQLNADLDHVQGLNDAGGHHAGQATIYERLRLAPGIAVRHRAGLGKRRWPCVLGGCSTGTAREVIRVQQRLCCR